MTDPEPFGATPDEDLERAFSSLVHSVRGMLAQGRPADAYRASVEGLARRASAPRGASASVVELLTLADQACAALPPCVRVSDWFTIPKGTVLLAVIEGRPLAVGDTLAFEDPSGATLERVLRAIDRPRVFVDPAPYPPSLGLLVDAVTREQPKAFVARVVRRHG